MKIYSINTAPNSANMYILKSEISSDCIIIDPGSLKLHVYNFLNNLNVNICKIIVTHDHESHTGGIKMLKKIYNPEIYAFKEVIKGFQAHRLHEDSVIQFEDINLKIFEAPGHTYDSICILSKGIIFTGDILQAGTVGQVFTSKISSRITKLIKNRIFNLPDNTIIYPGHGPATTINLEKQFNPYLLD